MSENNKERPDDATLIRSGGILEGVLMDRNMRVCAETVGDITARLSSLVQENTELRKGEDPIAREHRLHREWQEFRATDISHNTTEMYVAYHAGFRDCYRSAPRQVGVTE